MTDTPDNAALLNLAQDIEDWARTANWPLPDPWASQLRIFATQPCARCGELEAVEVLRELVAALDGAFISSWQSTAAWSDQLNAARTFLATQGSDHE